jgi:xanthine dehydrogenase small subunit
VSASKALQWPPIVSQLPAVAPSGELEYALRLNGDAVRIRAVSPTQTLLHVLHSNGYLGSKEGCGDGDCGACTVSVWTNGKPQAINSCLVPIAAVEGASLTTVEGVAHRTQATLHPVQQMLVECAGSQCGYCTPGFVMSLYAAFEAGETLSDETIEGNLCRCTGYTSLRVACQRLNAVTRPAPIAISEASAQEKRTADARYLRPQSIAEALQMKAVVTGAEWLAGGTDLGLSFSRDPHHSRPIIALDDIAELHGLRHTDHALELNALCTMAQLKAHAHGHNDPRLAAVHTMLHWFAATQVRNRATVGGNIGTASPIGDLLPVLLALDASVTLIGHDASRTLALADYFLGYRKTAKRDHELISKVTIPLAPVAAPKRLIAQSYKVGKRGSDDISIVAACFVAVLDANQRIEHIRLSYGGVAATPKRALQTETALLGRVFNHATLAELSPVLRAEFQPLSDFRGSSDYRSRLIVNLLAKFCAEFGASV